MGMEHDYLASKTNPNGLLAEFSNGLIESNMKEPRDRLVTAAADLHSFIHNVAEVDLDMSEVIIAHAVREIVHSLGIPVSDENLTEIIKDGIAISMAEMIDRTITMSSEQY
jgi:hypothetical protein